MAVFTPVTRDALEPWLSRRPVGALRGLQGIAEGVENSNFFVDTDAGRWVLTLFERLPPERLPFHLDLMRHLAARGVPCPDPVADADGALWSPLAGRPAALVTRLPGRGVERPTLAHCAPVGALLARMHVAVRDFPGDQPNPRGLGWCAEAAAALAPRLPAGHARLLADELDAQRAFAASDAYRALPRGAVHADLFRDNVLFEDGRLRGAIDFWFAGVDTLAFDLAVTCNDWCIDDASGELDPRRLDALLAAYQAERPLGEAERAAWPLAMRAAALRFWLSRLDDRYRPRPAERLTPKDPAHFERILRARRAGVPAPPAVEGASECR
ncbi:MAG TPA: homoserine kinase [Burkholderiaceae bacterium]|nr:homoserine kinase [Burkholderiaceae bacterium]